MSQSLSGEPMAISAAVRQMVRRMDKNNATLREVNDDLIKELRGLRTTLSNSLRRSRQEIQADKEARVTEFDKLRKALSSQTRTLARNIRGIGKETSSEAVKETQEETYKQKILEEHRTTNKLLSEILGKIELASLRKDISGLSGLGGGAAAAEEGAIAGGAAGATEGEVERLIEKEAPALAKKGLLRRLLGGAGALGGGLLKHIIPAAGALSTLALIGNTHRIKAGTPMFSMAHPLSSPASRIGEGALSGAMMGSWLDPFTFGMGSVAGAAIGAGGVAWKEFGISKYLKSPHLRANIAKFMDKVENGIGKYLSKAGVWIVKKIENAPQELKHLLIDAGKGLEDAKGVVKIIQKIMWGIEDGIGYAVKGIGGFIIKEARSFGASIENGTAGSKLDAFVHDMYNAVYSVMPTWRELGKDILYGAKMLTVDMIAPKYRKAIGKFLTSAMNWLGIQVPSWKTIEADLTKVGGAISSAESFIVNKFVAFKNDSINWVESFFPSWKTLDAAFAKFKHGDLISTIAIHIKNMFIGLINRVGKAINPFNWFGSDGSKVQKDAYYSYGGYGGAFSGYSGGSSGLIHDAAYHPYAPAYHPPSLPSGPVAPHGKYSASQQRIRNYIISMAKRMGISPNLALGIAGQESSFNPYAGNASGSYGLYQFLPGTWAEYAKRMGVNPNTARNSIEYQTYAGMLYLQRSIGILAKMGITHPTGADVYAMELLGHAGGKKFLMDMQSNPNASAASLFPSAAASNSALFYNHGHALSLSQLYSEFQDRVGRFYMSSNSMGKAKNTPYMSQPFEQNYRARQERVREPAVTPASYAPKSSAPTPDINGVPIHMFDNGLLVVNT